MFVSRLKSSDVTLFAESFRWPQTVIYRCVPPSPVHARTAYLLDKPKYYKINNHVDYAIWVLDNDSPNVRKRFFFLLNI